MEEKVRELIDKLHYYTKKYDEGHPEISDQEWDKLYFELFQMENETGLFFKDSPTQNIKYEVINELTKVNHNHKMLSLDKTKDINVIKGFIKDKDTIVMAKMDGLTCSLRYLNGGLVSAETRGNGLIGEDILHNAIHIDSIPNRINYKEELIIDGEIICRYDNFKDFSNEYANPRNFASGSIRLLDSEECSKRKLTFVAWEIIKGFEEQKTLDAKLKEIEKLNFVIVPFRIENIDNAINEIKEQCKLLQYPIDGVVFKFNDISYGQSLGETGHHFKNAMAYKFYDELYETNLLNIEWSMGRTGILTPVATFEPINIDGTEVSRASLHNYSVLKETLHGIGWKGQKIFIYKANQIIPQIGEAEEDDDRTKEYIEYPHICPICKTETSIKNSNGIENIVCPNDKCEGKLINIIEHFTDMKKGMAIKGISKAIIEKLINWNWLNSFSDLYELKNHREEWIVKPGFGEKSVDNILNAIEKSKNCSLESFISALGIPLIGLTNAKEIVKHINTYEEFVELCNNHFDFWRWDTFAEEKTSALWQYDFTEANKVYSYLAIQEKNTQNNNEQKMSNIIFCITGKLNLYKNRDELTAEIEALGGKVVGSISKNVQYLINNDRTSTSAKNNKAKDLGINIITEQELVDTFDLKK